MNQDEGSEPRGAEPDTQANGLSEAVRTFRLPYYGRVWTSNLIQFICFQVLFLAMQWLVTSLTPLRSAVGMAAPQATVPALGAAELVGAALEAFAVDPALLDAERGRIKLLLVDDAQHLDPQAALLVRVLAAGAQLTVIAGDPSQTVFGYRGAEPTLLYGPDDQPQVVLTESHRCSPAVAGAVAAVARRLPGVDASRALTPATTDELGSLDRQPGRRVAGGDRVDADPKGA